MLYKQTRYTIEELKGLLNHYIDTNGLILGKIYFKTHLYKRNKMLPAAIDNIGRFINENIRN